MATKADSLRATVEEDVCQPIKSRLRKKQDLAFANLLAKIPLQ